MTGRYEGRVDWDHYTIDYRAYVRADVTGSNGDWNEAPWRHFENEEAEIESAEIYGVDDDAYYDVNIEDIYDECEAALVSDAINNSGEWELSD